MSRFEASPERNCIIFRSDSPERSYDIPIGSHGLYSTHTEALYGDLCDVDQTGFTITTDERDRNGRWFHQRQRVHIDSLRNYQGDGTPLPEDW